MKKLFLISLTVSLLLVGCTVPPPEATAPGEKVIVHKEEYTQEKEYTQEDKITGVVSWVTDGDSLKVVLSSDYEIREGVHLSKGDELTIRLLLVDTPESVGEKAGMPFGAESSAYAKGLLQDKTVTLEFDEGDLKDRYDRYLAYVYLDGKRVQDYLLENGYAMVRYVFEPNTRYLSELREIEKQASNNSIGIWSIDNYAVIGEGFNEVDTKPNLKAIGEDVKTKAQETAGEFFGESIDSIINSFSGE